ncbi:MAG: GIY-YIG nuclease family protein [Gemmataceae bacterium]
MAVYFIEAVGTNKVKIGFTDGPVESRLRQLQTGCPVPLAVRAVVEGDQKAEGRFHRRFAHLKQEGEWFELGPDLARFMDLAEWVLPRLEVMEAKIAALVQTVGQGTAANKAIMRDFLASLPVAPTRQAPFGVIDDRTIRAVLSMFNSASEMEAFENSSRGR